MCGVFGFFANGDQAPNLKRIKELAVATEQRGPDAFGFAWIDAAGRLRAYKSPGRISEHLDLLDLASEARVFIGHCRWATHGDPAVNGNNHPHPCDGGWVVHNGVLHDHAELVERYDLHPISDCDSEAIALLIEDADQSTLMGRVVAALKRVGESPLVVLGVWKPDSLIVARSGNPLWMAETNRGMYFASRAKGLPGTAEIVPDETVLHLTGSGKEGIEIKRASLRACPLPARPAVKSPVKSSVKSELLGGTAYQGSPTVPWYKAHREN